MSLKKQHVHSESEKDALFNLSTVSENVLASIEPCKDSLHELHPKEHGSTSDALHS